MTVTRTIATGIKRAYAAWADPALLSRWFTTTARRDFQVGGRYENSDGDSGEFLKIVPNRLIRFTWENKQPQPESRVNVEFSQQGENCTAVRLTHEKLKTKKDADKLKQGWSWAMDSLKSFLETGIAISYSDWLKQGKHG